MSHGFMYLVGLIDIFSRYLLAWRFSNVMDTSFCLEMLDEGLITYEQPEIVNTDQGSQFTSTAWTEKLELNSIRVSMDGQGRWVDNVFIERFWRTIKYEHILLHSYASVNQARESINHFIGIYNNRRVHQSLGYRTPAEVYFDKKHGSSCGKIIS